MSDEVLTIDVRTAHLVQSLLGAGDRLADDMTKAVDRLTIEVQAHVKDRKLSGQVLHVRSGTLRRSINRATIVKQGSIEGQVGTNVKYAAIHEYGFHGSVGVRSYVRSTAKWGDVTVRAHTRVVNMPMRSFLRTTLADDANHITMTLREAAVASVRRSVQEGGG